MAIVSDNTPARRTSQRLVRRTDQRMIAGVAAGMADYFDIDPTLVRLGFVLLTFFGGSGVILYLVMWVVMPKPEHVDAAPRDVARSNMDDMMDEARRAGDSVRDAVRSRRRSGGDAPPPSA
jgi:phage shock protein PspC (stress-responsive transcriptional regulator)